MFAATNVAKNETKNVTDYNYIFKPLATVASPPFLYFIVEKQSGAILFMGTMNNPSAT
jgi:serine protease inhibitor